MSFLDSQLELSYNSDDQESRSMSSFDSEVEDITSEHEDSIGDSTEKGKLAYADEPLADEEWLKNYERQEKRTES